MSKVNPPKAYKNLDFLMSPDARELRILSEFVEPKSRFSRNKIKDTIVFFGSARILPEDIARKNLELLRNQKEPDVKELKKCEKELENSRYYEDAVELAKRLTKWSINKYGANNRLLICSGGGPGIMEAANKGAKLAGGKSIGLNISLPYEQFANPYIDDELNFEFHYFFMRKFWFAYLAKAMIIFPGGFGTLDELMEILTLVQTGKIKKPMKILIYDRKYWDQIINIDNLVNNYTISESDLNLFEFCESVDEMEEKIVSFFSEKN
ncbi:MAG: TIGR00730 family Rossman fold protein [Bacteroidetes bacterium]|nr:TIGR00730 family Rossman fold protein [Bacteroidota bacterium]